MGTKSKNIALLIVVLLLVLVATFQQTAVAQPTNSSVVPATLWQQNYRDYDVLVGGRTLSNLIQTSDGGFAFLSLGYTHQGLHPAKLFKVNSIGNIEWVKTLDSFTASNISQTSDGGYNISGNWRPAESIYLLIPALIKTDSNGNIQWSENYSSTPIFGEYTNKSLVSTIIPTSDGGFAYIRLANIVKTDSKNQTQWEKHVTYTQPQSVFAKENHWPVRIEPVELCSLIETSDGSLAAIGVVLTVSDMPYNGMASLIKTETSLPLPTPTPTSAIPEFSSWTIPLLLTIMVASAGLLVYHKKHKNKP